MQYILQRSSCWICHLHTEKLLKMCCAQMLLTLFIIQILYLLFHIEPRWVHSIASVGPRRLLSRLSWKKRGISWVHSRILHWSVHAVQWCRNNLAKHLMVGTMISDWYRGCWFGVSVWFVTPVSQLFTRPTSQVNHVFAGQSCTICVSLFWTDRCGPSAAVLSYSHVVINFPDFFFVDMFLISFWSVLVF